tara:strand:- start:1071 stop:1325 length:255 start_codon:yes stop_codon:yes gene_type:complete
LDPLDPLTEIIRSGQAFSPFIFLERLIWLMIGFFFIGALTSGMRNNIKDQSLLGNKTSFIGINKKSDKKSSSINEDSEENISQS